MKTDSPLILEQGHWNRRKGYIVLFRSPVWSLSSRVCLMHKKPCVAVFIFKTRYQTVDTAADFPPEHISIGLSSETILCCNSVWLLPVSISLPGNAGISHKLFSSCPSLIPGSPKWAAEPLCPGTASGRKSKCCWARGKHFWLFWSPCCFMPCMKEFSACSNPSKTLKKMSVFKHNTFFLNTRQWTSGF